MKQLARIISIFVILLFLSYQISKKHIFLGKHDKILEQTQATNMIWYKPQQMNQGLPNSIQIFASNSSYTPGVPLTCFYTLIDMSDESLNFQTVYGSGSQKKMTPQQFASTYTQQGNKVYAVLNGGFFNVATGDSQGLIIQNNNLISLSPQQNGNYYPTMGAFGMFTNRDFQSAWVYNILPNDTTYAYPQPSPINQSQPPLPRPNATYPAGGQQWNVEQAIGAGPLLLKNGIFYNDGYDEMFGDYIMNTRHPRSAICKTQDGKLVFFAADGRQSFSQGLFINETAYILQSIGCVDAINLDGGGSTCLYANSQIINNPSDASGPRPVANAVMILAKTN